MTLRLFALTLSIACFASFAWAVRRYFQKPCGISWEMKLIMASGNLFAIAQFAAIMWLDSTIDSLWLAGMLCFVISFALFWWTVASSRATPLNIAFTSTNPERLLNQGPYARIRHPFYASYLIYWVGGLLVTRWWPMFVAVFVMGGLYLIAAAQEERDFISGPMSDAYIAYKPRTGLFWPWVGGQDRVGRTTR